MENGPLNWLSRHYQKVIWFVGAFTIVGIFVYYSNEREREMFKSYGQYVEEGRSGYGRYEIQTENFRIIYELNIDRQLKKYSLLKSNLIFAVQESFPDLHDPNVTIEIIANRSYVNSGLYKYHPVKIKLPPNMGDDQAARQLSDYVAQSIGYRTEWASYVYSGPEQYTDTMYESDGLYIYAKDVDSADAQFVANILKDSIYIDKGPVLIEPVKNATKRTFDVYVPYDYGPTSMLDIRALAIDIADVLHARINIIEQGNTLIFTSYNGSIQTDSITYQLNGLHGQELEEFIPHVMKQ